MAKKKKDTEYDIKELQTWLKGIMEFQNDDWSPTKEQWEVIYNKIMSLTEKKVKQEIAEPSIKEIVDRVVDSGVTLKKNEPDYGMNRQNVIANRELQGTETAPQESFGNIFEEQHPQQNDALPSGPELSKEEIDRMIKEKQQGESGVSASSGKVHKTPSIDTMTDGYKSGFE